MNSCLELHSTLRIHTIARRKDWLRIPTNGYATSYRRIQICKQLQMKDRSGTDVPKRSPKTSLGLQNSQRGILK